MDNDICSTNPAHACEANGTFSLNSHRTIGYVIATCLYKLSTSTVDVIQKKKKVVRWMMSTSVMMGASATSTKEKDPQLFIQ